MHVINLKAAWEASDADAQAPPTRVALPLDWAAVAWPEGRVPSRARLVRRFGRPPLEGDEATFRVRLRGVAGVSAMELNGSPIAWREEGDDLVVAPDELRERNALTVWVDVSRAAMAPGLWGAEARLECG